MLRVRFNDESRQFPITLNTEIKDIMTETKNVPYKQTEIMDETERLAGKPQKLTAMTHWYITNHISLFLPLGHLNLSHPRNNLHSGRVHYSAPSC